MKTKRLGRRIYHKIGSPLFEAWYSNLENTEIETVRRAKNFKTWDEPVEVFNFNGKTYTECGIDNFNGHFSNYRDRDALFGVYLREVEDL